MFAEQRRLLVAGAAFVLLAALPLAAQASEDLEARIAEAEELNVTVTLEESQAALDALADEMAGATPRQRARVTLLLARNLAIGGEHDRALELLGPLREGFADPDLQLDAFRISANVALNQDDFEQGYLHLREGLELLHRVDAPKPRVKLLAVANWFFSLAGEPNSAVNYSREALALARESGDDRLICIALGELSIAQYNAGKLEDAFSSRKDALRACESAGDPVLSAVYRVGVGEMMVELGEVEAGLEIVRRGLAETRETGYRDGVLEGEIALANGLARSGRFGEAAQLLEPMIEELDRLALWRNLQEVHELLSDIAEQQGDYRVALDHEHRADDAGDKLVGLQRATRAAYLQAEFDIQLKEQQIALLEQRNRVLELQERSERQARYLAVGGLTAAVLIGGLLVLLLLRSRLDRRHLLWLSQRDGLTGLRNHVSFFRTADEARLACREAGQPFTLVMGDIDFFKSINDRLGHTMGDSVLKQVGETLSEVFDAVGIVGRIGGEEFGIALPGVRTSRAVELIDEFQQRLQPVQDDGSSVAVTMSWGVSEIGGDRSTEFMRRFADEALYEAKRQGRDCVVDAGDVCDDDSLKASMNRRADDPR